MEADGEDQEIGTYTCMGGVGRCEGGKSSRDRLASRVGGECSGISAFDLS